MSAKAVERRFRPGLWPTLMTLILFPLFIRLGFWQLERAEEKQQIVDTYEARMQQDILQLAADSHVGADLDYRHAMIPGSYDNDHQILLDNKIHNGQAGYQVLTPFKIGNSEKWILVNRGWVPLGRSRQELPDIQVPQSTTTVTGLLKKPLKGQFVLEGGNIWSQRWPKVVQWLALDEVVEHTNRDFMPYVLLLSSDQSNGYAREWELIASSPEQSESYAVQWFSFAAILLGLFLFLNYKKVQPGER